MLMSSSPLDVALLKVSTAMKPLTTVPSAAFGVMVRVMVPDWPGASVSGVEGALALTVCAQMSPVLADMAVANGLVRATPVSVVVPGPGAAHGQVGTGAAHSWPGATSGVTRVATESSPTVAPSSSGSLSSELMSKVIGRGALAAPMSSLVWGGTTQCGVMPPGSGSGTDIVAAGGWALG